MATLSKVLPSTYTDFNTTGDEQNSVFYPVNCMIIENSYGIWGPAANQRTSAEYKGFNFSSIPDDAIIDGISVLVRYKYKNISDSWQLREQCVRKNGIKVGLTFDFSFTVLGAATTYTNTGDWTVQELKNDELGVFIDHYRSSSSTANYLYVYYIYVNVEYHTLSRPLLTIVSASRNKIGKTSGMNECMVQFSSNQNLIEWEARANDGAGTQTGLLVGSGGMLTAETLADFSVDAAELTEGDKEYTITVYGKNADGEWSI